MKYPKYKIYLFFVDYLVIVFSFILSYNLTNKINILSTLNFWIFFENLILAFSFPFIILIIFKFYNLYKIEIIFSILKQIVLITISLLYSIILLIIFFFFSRSEFAFNNRLAVVIMGAACILGVSFVRVFIFRPLFKVINNNDFIKKKVIIVGTNMVAKSFALEMMIDNIYGFQLVGFIDTVKRKNFFFFDKFEIIGITNEIPRIIKDYKIDEIIIAESGSSYKELLYTIDLCKTTSARLNVASPLFDIIHKKFVIDSYFNIPITPLLRNNYNGLIFSMKRVVDIVGSLFGIIIFAIPFIIVALLIKITSDGPVLYKQLRVGKDGVFFNFYKFRTMKVGSDIDEARKKRMTKFIKNSNGKKLGSTKDVNANMITPIGKFLRKKSIDELPQLFNVLKGEMSLVGPRPCLPYEFEAYDEWHKKRLLVLPGCTGLWQVSARSESNYNEMVVLDLYYIGNMSPILDLQLILKTIPVMFFGRGAE